MVAEIVIDYSDIDYYINFRIGAQRRTDDEDSFSAMRLMVKYNNDGTFTITIGEIDEEVLPDYTQEQLNEMSATEVKQLFSNISGEDLPRTKAIAIAAIRKYQDANPIRRVALSNKDLKWVEVETIGDYAIMSNDEEHVVELPKAPFTGATLGSDAAHYLSDDFYDAGWGKGELDIYLRSPTTGDKFLYFNISLEWGGSEEWEQIGSRTLVASINDADGVSKIYAPPFDIRDYGSESAVVSGKKKGKVVSLIGSDPRLRELKKDKDITPEEAASRLDISAESFEHAGSGRLWPNCASCNNPIPKDTDGEPDDIGDGTGRGSCCACVYCYEEMCSGDCDAKEIYYGAEAETKLEVMQECLFCEETESEFIEVILDGYPELICEHCADPNNWAAENWGGDPEGPLAKALAKARASLKNKKPLNITKLPDRDQKSLDEFNGAVVYKQPKGIVERVLARHMAMQELRISEAILELEQYIRLGMISEEDAFRKIVAMSR